MALSINKSGSYGHWIVAIERETARVFNTEDDAQVYADTCRESVPDLEVMVFSVAVACEYVGNK